MHQGATGPHDVIAHLYSAGSWTPELIATEANSASVGMPVVTMAAGGLAVAAFNSGTGLNVATRSGSKWTVASSTLPSAEFGLSATVNDAGDVLVGFMDSTTFPKTYQYDATAKTWTGPTARSSAGESSAYGQCPLTVALSTMGDGILTRCFSSVPRTIESYSYTKTGNSWGSAAALPSSGWPFIVSFAFDAAGDGFAAWTNSPSSSYQPAPAVLSTFSPGSGWSPESTPLGGTVTADTLAAFVSPNGRGWVAWNEGTSAVVKKVR